MTTNPQVTAVRGYVICTTPRAGSNWLGQLLSSTNVLGHPREYFNGPARRILSDAAYPANPKHQLQRVLTNGVTSNGIYGVKLFAHQYRKISRAIRLTQDLPDLHFVYLMRKDVLGQAISWARARQTEQYRSTQGQRRTPAYDRRAIAKHLRAIAEERRQWSVYFARTGLSPLELVYEELLLDAQAGIDRVAELFEVSAVVRAERIDLGVQRDSLTEEWRRRFINEMGDPTRF